MSAVWVSYVLQMSGKCAVCRLPVFFVFLSETQIRMEMNITNEVAKAEKNSCFAAGGSCVYIVCMSADWLELRNSQ